MHDAPINGWVSGKVLARVSTELVQLYARHCGRGPTQAKARIAGNMVVCVFRDTYTDPERSLIARGEFETVERMRDAFHEAMEPESRRIIEENCGRRVIACLAATHVDPDIAVEIFVMEPPAEPSALLGGSETMSVNGNGLPSQNGHHA